jgi:hypothetical protein
MTREQHLSNRAEFCARRARASTGDLRDLWLHMAGQYWHLAAIEREATEERVQLHRRSPLARPVLARGR